MDEKRKEVRVNGSIALFVDTPSAIRCEIFHTILFEIE